MNYALQFCARSLEDKTLASDAKVVGSTPAEHTNLVNNC